MPRDKDSRKGVLTELFVVLVREFSLLLARHYPLGLAQAGAPHGEYDAEAGQMRCDACSVRRTPPTTWSGIVSEVFMEYFGPEYGEGFEALSQDMWSAYELARQAMR